LDEFGGDTYGENVGEYNEDDLFGDTEARDVTIPKENATQQATTSATRHRTTDEEVLDFEDDDPLADVRFACEVVSQFNFTFAV
jgi:hypothetical protein